MAPIVKHLRDLTLADFDEFPVWRGDIEGDDEESVSPILGKTSITPQDCLIWVRFRGSLADGTPIVGIASADGREPDLVAPSYYIEGKWLVLHMPGAPDFVLRITGPEPFARALGRAIPEVFPIRLRSEINLEQTGRPIETLLTLDAR